MATKRPGRTRSFAALRMTGQAGRKGHRREERAGTVSGGRVHPRTRAGGGARRIQVLFEGGRRKLACRLPTEKRTQETMGGAGVEGAEGDRNGVPPEPAPCRSRRTECPGGIPGAPEPCFAPDRQKNASPGALEAFYAPGRRNIASPGALGAFFAPGRRNNASPGGDAAVGG